MSVSNIMEMNGDLKIFRTKRGKTLDCVSSLMIKELQ